QSIIAVFDKWVENQAVAHERLAIAGDRNLRGRPSHERYLSRIRFYSSPEFVNAFIGRLDEYSGSKGQSRASAILPARVLVEHRWKRSKPTGKEISFRPYIPTLFYELELMSRKLWSKMKAPEKSRALSSIAHALDGVLFGEERHPGQLLTQAVLFEKHPK